MNVVDCWEPYRCSNTTLGRFWFDLLDMEVDATGGPSSTPALVGTSDDAFVMQAPRDIGVGRFFGQGHQIEVASYPAAPKILAGAYDADGQIMAVLAMNTDGTLSVWNDTLSTRIAEDTDDPVPLATWTSIGLYVYIHASQGQAVVFVGGDVVRRADTINTDPNNRGGWAQYIVGATADIKAAHGYVLDSDSGPINPDTLIPDAFLLDAGPIGAGPTIYDGQWVPAGAATVCEAIDDADPDDDATRIKGYTVGTKYATEHDAIDLTTRKIYAVKQTAIVENVTGSGLSYSHRLLVNVDGSEAIAGWQSVTQDAWRAITNVWTTNPATGDDWTPASVNLPTYWGGFLEG